MKAPRTFTLLSLAVALCLSVVAVEAADKPSAPLFMDYLDVFGTSKSAKTAHYDGAQTETVCMQATNACTNVVECEPGDCLPSNFIIDLACVDCHPDGYTRGGGDVQDMLSGTTNVAKCVFNEANSGVLPLPDKPGVEIYGTFTAQCILKDEKGSCGHPDACENVIVEVTGVRYLIQEVIRDGPDVRVAFCGDSSKRGSMGARRISKSAPTTPPRTAAAAAYDGGYGAAPLPATVDVGFAFVWVGSMTVSSRHHAVKFDKGWFEATQVTATRTNVPSGEVATLPRIPDASVKFHFQSDKVHY